MRGELGSAVLLSASLKLAEPSAAQAAAGIQPLAGWYEDAALVGAGGAARGVLDVHRMLIWGSKP